MPPQIDHTFKMKHLAAVLLLKLGGNESPKAADVKKVLESVGIEADSERLDKLISELDGKDINEVRSATTHWCILRTWTQIMGDDGSP